MEALVFQAIEEVALEGAAGCSAPRLWQSLAEIQKDAEALNDPLKQAIWADMLEPGTPVSLGHPPKTTEKGAAKQQRRKRARAQDSDAEEDVADTEPEQEGSGLQPMASDEMEAALHDFGVAEQKGYWLQASQDMREAVLGIQDNCLSRYPLSDIQLTVLEKIASHRRAGVLRSEMAKAVNMDAKSFHYIATALEARGLIGSVQEMIQGAPAGPKLTLTSRLFLRRFLPRVVVQIEADVEAQQVVQALAACPDQTAVESDMKARLGYWEKDGRAKDPEISRRKHRKWRYTRERLIRSGQLEHFKGTVDVPSRSGEGTERRTINFIRLLAAQTPESKALALMPEDEAEGLEEPEIVAELGLNGQIMRRILQAGEEGVTRVSVAQSLGLTSKRANRALAAFAAKYHIRENFAQRGKTQIKMWKAPAALLAAHESTHPPPVPPGGWVAAVRRAVAPLEAEMTAADIPHPSDQPSSSQGAVPVGQPAQAAKAEGELAEMDVDNTGATQTAAAQQPQQAEPGLPEQRTHSGVKVLKVLCGGAIKVLKAPSKDGSTRVGDVTLRRERCLVDALQQQLFMRVSAIRRLFRETEGPDHAKHGTIDRHTIAKIIYRTVLAGQLQYVSIALPLNRSSQGAMERQFVVTAGVHLDDKLLQKVLEAHAQVPTRTITAGKPLEELPAMDKQFGIADRARSSLQEMTNDFQRALTANGYLRGRGIRMRLLHQHICAITGLVGVKGLTPQELLGSDKNREALIKAGLWKQSYWYRLKQRMQPPKLEGAAAGAAQEGVFNLKGLWDSLPFGLFLQACGSAASRDAVSALDPETDKAMGELTSEQVASLADARTFIRLKELLDGLSTLGLLKPSLVLTDSSGQSGGLKEARWAAETAAILEEPPAEAPEHQGFWGGAQGLTMDQNAVRKVYALQSEDGVRSYWAELENICSTSARDSAVRSCWPLRAMPELLGKRKWSMMQDMSYKQRVLLDAKLANRAGLEPAECRAIAAELGLAFQQVQSIAFSRKREALAKLQGVPIRQLVMKRPEGLSRGPGARWKRKLPPLEEMKPSDHVRGIRPLQSWKVSSEGVRQDTDVAALREDAGATGRSAAAAPMEIRQTLGEEAGMPVSLRDASSAQEQNLLPTELARREERERQIRAEQDANRKARRGTVTDEERKKVQLGRLHATRSKERAEDRAQLKRLLAQGKMTEADYGGPLPPSDDDEPAGNEYNALGPRRRFLQRKEDRVLLWAWFRFHCRKGLGDACYKRGRRLLPEYYFTEHFARGRILALKSQPKVAAAMQRLEEIAEQVYQSSAASKNRVAKPKEEAVPKKDVPAASEAGAEEEQDGEGEAKGSRAILLEQQYRERMDTILEGMQEGPLFQSTHERAKDMHAEAEGLLEEVLNSAEGRVGYPPPKPTAKRNRSRVVSEIDKRPSAHAAPEQRPLGPQAKKPKPAPAVAGAVPRPKRVPVPDDVISDVGSLSALAGQDRAFLDSSQMPGRSHKRLAPGLKAPTGAVAEAVELIRSMLLAAERAGESPAGQRAALLGRFTEKQLASAYVFLVAQGQVYSGGISKAYALSDAFKASLQVLEFPEDIFEEAALVAESLTGTSNSAAGSLHLAPDSYISSGLVAHAVTQLAAGQGTIKLGQVKVEDPSGGADRPDSSGTLRWEAHIEILSNAASPPQPATAAVPIQGRSREGADRDSGPPRSTAAHLDAAEHEELAAHPPQQSNHEHLATANGSAQPGEKDTLAGQVGREVAGNGAAPPLQQSKGQSQTAGAQAKPQVAPWTDADGALNEPYWRSLTQHAMSAVLRSPGIPEEALLDEMRALLPHSALRLLSILESEGLLSVRSVAEPAAQVPAVLRRPNHSSAAKEKVVRHFFPVLKDSFPRTLTILPTKQ